MSWRSKQCAARRWREVLWPEYFGKLAWLARAISERTGRRIEQTKGYRAVDSVLTQMLRRSLNAGAYRL